MSYYSHLPTLNRAITQHGSQQEQYGVTPQLAGIAIQRPQVVSGWDLEKRGPKPTRRLAPAGTVIFLNLEGSNDAIMKMPLETGSITCGCNVLATMIPEGSSTQSRTMVLA